MYRFVSIDLNFFLNLTFSSWWLIIKLVIKFDHQPFWDRWSFQTFIFVCVHSISSITSSTCSDINPVYSSHWEGENELTCEVIIVDFCLGAHIISWVFYQLKRNMYSGFINFTDNVSTLMWFRKRFRMILNLKFSKLLSDNNNMMINIFLNLIFHLVIPDMLHINSNAFQTPSSWLACWFERVRL